MDDREAQIKAKARKVKVNEANLVDFIIDYEDGALDAPKTLALFTYLVRTGQAWSLQGSYGRVAMALIEAGWIKRTGRGIR